MITLAGIELPDLIIEDEFAFTGVDCRVEMSLAGVPVVWEQTMEGRPIDLAGEDNSAWITRQILTELAALAAVPGATYVLDYEGEQTTVRFRHEEAPVIAAAPVMPTPEVKSDDRYNNVRIKLMEV